jgi:hypothetical protein
MEMIWPTSFREKPLMRFVVANHRFELLVVDAQRRVCMLDWVMRVPERTSIESRHGLGENSI